MAEPLEIDPRSVLALGSDEPIEPGDRWVTALIRPDLVGRFVCMTERHEGQGRIATHVEMFIRLPVDPRIIQGFTVCADCDRAMHEEEEGSVDPR